MLRRRLKEFITFCFYQLLLLTVAMCSNKIIRLKSNDIAKTATLIHNAFPLHSPHSWARAVGLQKSNLEYWLRETYLSKPVEIEDIGCYGITKKEELVGVIINERFPVLKIDGKEEEEVEDPLLRYAFSSFDALIDTGKDIVRNELIKRNENQNCLVGYVAWIATNENYRGQGIADELIKMGTNSMKDKGYKYSTAFCVSPTATRAFNKQGYASIKDIKYSEFECNGSKPFSILPDYLSIMVKELS